MSLVKVLILKLLAIDRFTSSSISVCKVTTLDHELLDNTVEDGAFKVEGLSSLAFTLFTSSQGSEVFCCFGNNIGPQFNHNATCWLSADGDVEKRARSFGGGFGGVGHGYWVECERNWKNEIK
jgi:hypothetical protein